MYAELHAISNFSFLRGASHPHELVAQAASLGYQAIALTDECSLAGVVKAHGAAKQHGIQLIIGAEFQLPEGLLVLLAPNRLAYGQICALITLGRRRAGKGRYELHLADFLTQSLGDCLLLWRPPLTLTEGHKQASIAGLKDSLAEYRARLKDIGALLGSSFGDRGYLLLERNLSGAEGQYLPLWQQVAKEVSLPCVAAGDVYMHHPKRQRLQDVLTCIRLGIGLEQAGMADLLTNAEHYLKPVPAIVKRFAPEPIARTLSIARRCHFSLDELRYEYPAEVVPAKMSAAAYLREEVLRGARRRFANQVPESVRCQYERELALIIELKYEYFFLTLYDIVRFAKSRGILHQGRGSAANSVVCYCLGITEVDPTKINMLFERFISRERHEPPDIDVDFEHERREEVIQYIYGKYGRERSALVATVICYRFKSAMGDVGKALGLDARTIAHLLRSVDRRDPDTPWQVQLEAQHLVPREGAGQFLLPLVAQLIGFPRHLSQHVGGFIIAAGPLSELVPVENAAMAERTVIQWDKDDIEALGLLKVDILALGMLSAIRKCFALISEHVRPFAMEQVVWEQPEVYRMLQRGDSIGVFQVESRAQMSMLPRLKPASYYDLVIQIAIVRPGPIQGDMVHPYLRRRDGLERVSYPSQAVESVLSRTLGVPIFQEQVIQLAMVAAGFSGGEADQLRRAMASWKKCGELLQFERKLLDGMASRGYSKDFSAKIYRQIRGFGEYGFPESHSASFALLAYVSAFLKYHYPAAFCCALLNSQPMGFYSPSQLLQDVRRHGVRVLPVCINHSQWQHSLERITDGTPPDSHAAAARTEPGREIFAIRLGLCQIKGLRQDPIRAMIATRPSEGFTSVAHLCRSGLGRSELALLAGANALQQMHSHVHQARWQLAAWQPSLPLFAGQGTVKAQESDIQLPPPSIAESVINDYQLLGLSLGPHPMALLRQAGALPRCLTAAQLRHCRHGQAVTVAGLVTGRQRPGTAAGVTFITLEDETGNINLLVWQGTARSQRQPYLASKILKVNGVLERQGEVLHVVAGRLNDVSAEMNKLVIKSRDFH
jgi:error-prone DNA polymerase